MKLKLIIFLLFWVSCSNNKEFQNTKIELLNRFPNSIDVDEEKAIGLLMCYTSDKEGSIILCDLVGKQFAKYYKNNNKKVILDFKIGKGPGDFIEPISMDTDSLGNIYIADMTQRRITKIDSLGNILSLLDLDMSPTQILVCSENQFYVIGFPNSYEGNLVRKYDINSKSLLFSFGKRISTPDSLLIDNCGESSRISMDSKGNIYLATFFPYNVRKYDPEGKLQSKFSYNPEYYFAPQKVGRIIFTYAGLRDIVALDEDLVLHSSYYNNKDLQKTEYFFDIVDLKAGKIISKLKLEDFSGLKEVRYMNKTGNYEILFDGTEPDFHIKKYKLLIKR